MLRYFCTVVEAFLGRDGLRDIAALVLRFLADPRAKTIKSLVMNRDLDCNDFYCSKHDHNDLDYGILRPALLMSSRTSLLSLSFLAMVWMACVASALTSGI